MTKPLVTHSMLIGAALRKARERTGLTQDLAADVAGIDPSAYSSMETGGVMPNVQRFWALAELYGTTPSSLLRACEQACDRAHDLADVNELEYPLTVKQATALVRLPELENEESVTTMTADKWNAAYPVGTPVRYHSVRGDAKHLDTTTRSEAWTLGHGAVIVAICGIAGGVSIDHLFPRPDEHFGAKTEPLGGNDEP